MKARGYSLVELVVTLALSGATVIFALFTTVVAVRSAQKGALTTALSAEAEVIALRLLDDIVRAGTHGDTRADIDLSLTGSDALSLVRPDALDMWMSEAEIAQEPAVVAITRTRVSWTRDGTNLWRTACGVGAEAVVEACVREQVTANARRLAFALVDDDGRASTVDDATRVRFTLELWVDGGGFEPITITLVDEARLGVAP
jgi:type II secretory pathway pseudopilin PulG